MFRTVPLSIIRSYSLYTQQWYMSYRSADSLRAGSGRNSVFPGGKVRPGRAADHLPPSSAAVMEEYSYTSTHPLGHTGPVTGTLYLLPL